MISESMLAELDIANMTEGAAIGSLQLADGFYAPIQMISEAESGFLATPDSAMERRAPGINTSDADGLINIILANPVVPPELERLLEEQKQNLIDLVGVGTTYIRKQAQRDPSKKYDLNLWHQVFNHLPLMGPSKFTRQTYSRRIRGVEIAKSFIDFLLNAVVAPQGLALREFQEFLRSQGNAIRFGTERNRDSFTMGSIGIILETIEIAGRTHLLPKIKANFVDFTRANYKFTAWCTKYEKVNIDFRYESAVSLFNYRALENPDVRASFERFIGRTQIDDIRESGDFFFEGEFPTEGGESYLAENGSSKLGREVMPESNGRIAELERLVGQLTLKLEHPTVA